MTASHSSKKSWETRKFREKGEQNCKEGECEALTFVEDFIVHARRGLERFAQPTNVATSRR